ncbi:PREDICTED: agamous-like MADS-box protein AGL62 [Ipomoea nil]|uniref:agamous-like MADS-box protein AGL62 n=1 Tax=Ipomoea nil TaxID=35883 RepID=UPI000901CD69|nr:PREDICTED: agamous-like MADS-box protein AGL62 [Ipomoea nil]
MENKTGKKKQTQGRRKIEIKKIDNVSHRHVAFSKRRIGLFNKASELCILCGTQAVAIVESYGGKRVFTFGHPSADAVIDRFLSNAPRPASPEPYSPEEENVAQLYHRAWQELAAEKEKIRLEEEEERHHGCRGDNWWHLPIEHMGATELGEFTAALNELKKKAVLRSGELVAAAAIIADNNNDPNNNNLSSSEVLTMLMNNNDDIVGDCFNWMAADDIYD